MRVIPTTGVVAEDAKMIVQLPDNFAPGVYDVVLVLGDKVAEPAGAGSQPSTEGDVPEVMPSLEETAPATLSPAPPAGAAPEVSKPVAAPAPGPVPSTFAPNGVFVEMFKHNLWANLRLLDACAALDEAQLGLEAGGTYGAIRNTLVHLLAAEGRYLSRLLGTPEPTFHERQGWPGIAELRIHAEASGQDLISYAEQSRGIRTLRGIWRGEPYAMPDSVPLVQAIQHGNEHRTNITTVLAQHGIEPPDLSMWAYDRETRNG